MKIKILSVAEQSDKLIVEFECQAGKGLARWRSSPCRIIKGQDISIELDIRANIVLGVNASYSEELSPLITIEDNGVISMRLVVESQDEDGLAYCRLSSDCLIMVESDGCLLLDIGRSINLTLQSYELELTVI